MDEKEKKKKRYNPPAIVDLSGMARAKGACEAGSSFNSGSCITGPSAGGSCLPGTTADGEYCGSGWYAAATCSGGITPA